MCLEIQKVNGELPIKIAERDIPCLKIVERRESGYVTPYRYANVPREVLRGEKLFLPDRSLPGDYQEECGFTSWADIGAGAIHVYECGSDSIRSITSEVFFLLHWPCGYESVVYLCVIPKGTEYLEGTFDGHRCYGSKAIRFERELLRFYDKIELGESEVHDRVRQKLTPIINELESSEK